MKLYILSGTIILLMTGISLVSNRMDVWGQSEGTLKKYENFNLGISFLYPREWNESIGGLSCVDPALVVCVWTMSPVFSNESGNPLESTPKIYKENSKESTYIFSLQVFPLDKPSVLSEACNCNTLKDFVAWDYTKNYNEKSTFVNDNQTVIGKNYTAWQTEFDIIGGNKMLMVYSLDGNFGYRLGYSGPPDHEFGKYMDGFKNMLKTVILVAPPEEKKPSFLG